jgi:hypothetical protein
MRKLVANITGCTRPIQINTTSSHSSQIATASFEVMDTTLDIGSPLTIDMGYEDEYGRVFTGYVKSIDRKEPGMTYQILASDTLTRAAEYFIASDDPNAPFSRSNILLENLVSELLGMAGLYLHGWDATYFTIGVSKNVEVNLTGCLDYCRYLGDIVTWCIWADEFGDIWFKNRKPYVMGGDSPIGTINSLNTVSAKSMVDGNNLRNKIVIYGSGSVHAVASDPDCPYLPAGFFKTVVINCAQLFVAQEMAQMAADYNLEVLDRLTNTMSVVALGEYDYLARRVITANFPLISVDNSDWYIFSAEHNWSEAGYTCSLELKQ